MNKEMTKKTDKATKLAYTAGGHGTKTQGCQGFSGYVIIRADNGKVYAAEDWESGRWSLNEQKTYSFAVKTSANISVVLRSLIKLSTLSNVRLANWVKSQVLATSDEREATDKAVEELETANEKFKLAVKQLKRLAEEYSIRNDMILGNSYLDNTWAILHNLGLCETQEINGVIIPVKDENGDYKWHKRMYSDFETRVICACEDYESAFATVANERENVKLARENEEKACRNYFNEERRLIISVNAAKSRHDEVLNHPSSTETEKQSAIAKLNEAKQALADFRSC